MRAPLSLLALVIVLLAGVAGCSESQTASSDEPRIVEQTLTLAPSIIPVTIGPLAGELSNLSVVRRTTTSTGDVVYPPQLTGTLVLTNTSEDQAVRLIGGEVIYIGPGGAPVKFAEGRNAEFTFPSYAVDRLDPGRQMQHRLDVSFPAAAFTGGVEELRLGLTYLPMPYRVDTATVDVSVAKQGS